MPENQRPSNFKCETDHVDGKTNALNRKKWIEWLKGNSDGVCRILSNARCLCEGIDVPALDAVLFMSPRNSHVDIVQAVGRVRRKAEGKQYGYIVLPVAIPAGADPADILNDNERFASVWNVLRALRSHDDRLNAEINRIDLNTSTPDRIIFTGLNEDGDGAGLSPALNGQQLFLPMDLPADAIFAKIVEKCGDRKYWESWAKDVADIFLRVVGRIESLLDTPENEALREWFDDFHSELQSSINNAITRSNAIDMMAQHILTRPVFEALFENYDFASGNPVAIALDKLRNDFAEFGLENETRDLEKFYESVRMRARGIDNSDCYANYIFIQRKHQMDRIFPNSFSENRVICAPGIGSKKPFSTLMTDTMPDMGFNAASQCFPRYRYPKPTDASNATGTFEGIDAAPDRIDNISDTALQAFQNHYNDDTITKDAIFDYVYGILHAPSYREEFANDLSKMIPRIPFAPDFHAFAEAGAALANLHLNYETCEQYPLELVFTHDGDPQPHHFRLGKRAMRFAHKETKTTLIINEHVRLSGIPDEAHHYIVNGRTPLEWFIDRYKITQDKDSGITNDPNGWFADPRDLVTAIARIVYVSVESARIVEGMPLEITDD